MKPLSLIILPLAGAAIAAAWPGNRTRPWLLPVFGGVHFVLTLWLFLDPPGVAPGAWLGFDPLARALPLLPEHAGTLLVPGAIASMLTGFILLIGRAKAISQVCGYLILENGIYLFGLLLIHSTPLLVESGILLDVTVGVFVIGIIVDRIQRAFDSLDTRKLTILRE